jgi:hypothetical protein
MYPSTKQKKLIELHHYNLMKNGKMGIDWHNNVDEG